MGWTGVDNSDAKPRNKELIAILTSFPISFNQWTAAFETVFLFTVTNRILTAERAGT
jgi:hypothetical protein